MDASPPKSSEVEAPPKRSRGRPRLYPPGDPRYAERAQEAQKRYREANPEAKRQSWRKYRRINPRGNLIIQSRCRAEKSGIDHSITVDDLYWPTHCPVLGIELQYGTGTMADRDWSPSLDRHDNDQGYIPGNVRVISNRANRLKNNATWQELEAVARYARYGMPPDGLEAIW